LTGVYLRVVVTGPAGSQIVFDDPSGNPTELFQSAGSWILARSAMNSVDA